MERVTKCAVTGSSGFVGGALCRRLAMLGIDFVAPTRSDLHGVDLPAKQTYSASGAEPKWSARLRECNAVVHLAARVHVMRDPTSDPIGAFREVNTTATLALARQAASAGVKRFVFVSSIKVNGERTHIDQVFRYDQTPAPEDPYAISKCEAEDGLRALARQTAMEIVIIRPPLVYGPGVRANFASMIRAVKLGWPLPLGAVTDNRRSLVALDNLVDLLITCLDHPAAANQTFLVSDGEDLSTADLLRRLGLSMGKPAWLLSVPVPILRAGAGLVGVRASVQRLLDNLQVDISHTKETLGWRPPIMVDEGLRRAVADLSTL